MECQFCRCEEKAKIQIKFSLAVRMAAEAQIVRPQVWIPLCTDHASLFAFGTMIPETHIQDVRSINKPFLEIVDPDDEC